ncbi:hypothetical protein G7Y89_g3680 [Cudoniella acicularis]|uniref:FAD-binding domain-containing protein n=1 Tax=Cudoniella acicularis TaxID=354080 RepID=A0A8H4W5Q7_9HELO|nr:hypothetical protein G7Y89_g3680 [Cudoniella acicularis]
MPLETAVIIIGAGVVGLVLAQALKKSGIAFEIYDRDEHIDARSHGWGITIHWALDALRECLPPKLFSQLKSIQVDPEVGRNDTGQFLFLNLANAEPVFRIPPSKRLRIHREKFRKLLLDGIDVKWNKSITGFSTNADGAVVEFQGGSIARGKLLIGADGANSKLRRMLCPNTGLLNQLPIRFLGVTVKMSPKAITPLRALDPLLFQGCHPDTGSYLWFAVLDNPEVNGSFEGDEYYSAQLNISWPVRSSADEVPASNKAKLQKMKDLADVFDERFRTVIQGIPEDTEVMEVKLADWLCLEWPNHGEKVTLIGDAAHAMTMYRGEAGNHGIMDALKLKDQLLRVREAEVSQKSAVDDYENEMRERTVWAVKMSRQACLDAHDFKSLNKNSAILARRAQKL